MWKRNESLYKKLAYEIYKNTKICVKCYSLDNIHVHHKDLDPGNNIESNLQILCRSCHTKLHNKWRKHSKETRKKTSIALKWRKLSEETKKKIGLAGIGRKHSEETKKKMSINISIALKWKLVDWMWVTERRRKTWQPNNQFYKLAI